MKWGNKEQEHISRMMFSIIIQMPLKICFSSHSILWSLQDFTLATIVPLSWHVEDFVAVFSPGIKLEHKFSVEFKLQVNTL